MSQVKIILFLAAVSSMLGGITAALLDKRTVVVERSETAEILRVYRVNEQAPMAQDPDKANNLSGVSCDNFERRPFAVMIAEDEEARPLSGIGLADLVIEIPVVTSSITRMMALFVCEEPKEIGSVRSARHDFIALAKGYDAIFAHWGGSHLALEELSKKTIDNLDALPNYFNAFFRKNWIPAPHNGFTSMRRLVYAAQNLGYRLRSNFQGYKFEEAPARLASLPATASRALQAGESAAGGQNLTINYIYPYNVKYEYNPATNLYYRWRGGREEIDKVTQFQASTRNVVIMRAKSWQIEGNYNDVDTVGSGEARVYRNGEEIKGSWAKKNDASSLRFYDTDGEEIAFTPGSIWIHVVEPGTVINYN